MASARMNRTARLAALKANPNASEALQSVIARMDPPTASEHWAVFIDETQPKDEAFLKAVASLRRDSGGNDMAAEINRQLAEPTTDPTRLAHLRILKCRGIGFDLSMDEEADPPVPRNQTDFDDVLDFCEAVLEDAGADDQEKVLALETIAAKDDGWS